VLCPRIRPIVKNEVSDAVITPEYHGLFVMIGYFGAQMAAKTAFSVK
jgi:hypothetical protein